MFLSLIGQFVIHLATMYLAVAMSKPHLPDNFKVSILTMTVNLNIANVA